MVNIETLIKACEKEPLLPCRDEQDPYEWARLGLFLGIRLLPKIRRERFLVSSLLSTEKEDGSPATSFEEDIEREAFESLKSFWPDSGMIAEELGNLEQDAPFQLVIDPIDGTRSFLSAFDTYAFTLSLIRGREPMFSLIGSPATNDLAFRISHEPSYMFQLPFEGTVVPLPLLPPSEASPLLVNLHPSLEAFEPMKKLYEHWRRRDIALVKSVSGSPALQILEVAKGGSTYANMWSGGRTAPYDLLSSQHLLKGAGGYLINKEGEELDPWDHRGLYLAGMNPLHLTLIREVIREP